MSDDRLELFRTHRAAQEKYIYFILAAAGAAIALVLNQTKDSKLEWAMLPLGLAVLCFGLSFIFGCQHLRYVESILYANYDLLRVEAGFHPMTGRHPQRIEVASAGIRDAIEGNSEKSVRYARWQFHALIGGALLFIIWHVLEMYHRTHALEMYLRTLK
jgi:hypothetical protein